MKEKKAKVERFKKFQRMVLVNKGKVEVGDIDIRNYAKFILKEEANIEKRELLSCLKNEIKLKNKLIYL